MTDIEKLNIENEIKNNFKNLILSFDWINENTVIKLYKSDSNVVEIKNPTVGKIRKLFTNKNQNKIVKTRNVIIIILSSLFLFIIFGYPILIQIIYSIFNFPVDQVEHFGQFGDMYGILSSIFSGSALIMIIISFIQEKKEHREDQLENKKNQQENEKRIENQKDYDNFNALLNGHIKIIDQAVQGNLTGNQCLGHALRQLTIVGSFDANYIGYAISIKKYFRSLVAITKYLDEKALPENRLMFIDLLAPHIIGNELKIIHLLDIHIPTKQKVMDLLNQMRENVVFEIS